MRAKFVKQAGDEFDASKPPIEVPELIPMSAAQRVCADTTTKKKGKAAA